MPIDPITAGAIISGGVSLGSNMIQNAGNKKSQARANKYNVDFWKMQNEYNNPINQMSRLKAAGLNPNLIYGSSSSNASGMAEKIAPAKAEPFQFDNPMRDITLFQDVGIKKAQQDNLAEQNTNIAQDTLLKASETAKRLSEGQSASTRAKIDKALLQTSIDASKENLRQMEQRTIGFMIDNTVKDRTQADLIKKAFYEAELVKSQLSGQDKLNALRDLEFQLKEVGLENASPLWRIIFRGIDKIKGGQPLLPDFRK